MPQKIKKLSPYSAALNQRAFARVQHIMAKHKLNQKQVAALLGVTPTTVTYWRQDKVRCPDNAAELLTSLLETLGPESLKRLSHEAL